MLFHETEQLTSNVTGHELEDRSSIYAASRETVSGPQSAT
jgi:hypothetical protein